MTDHFTAFTYAVQVLGVLVLFTKERVVLSSLRSRRDLKEAEVLVRLECGVLMAMLLIELVVLVLRAPCTVAG
ncbi:hypothetical protein NL676_033615 [Syzygium grande]|nr:hypothetical protein NL676_033615 [Syzygium grande]